MNQLDLSAFIYRYLPFCLSIDFRSDLKSVENMVSELTEREVPDRVRRNIVAMSFGLDQFVRFLGTNNVKISDLWFYENLTCAIESITDALIEEAGASKVALDHLIQELSTMAEIGKLQQDIHYRSMYPKCLAIRLDACLAEFRRYHRETQLDGELLSNRAYQQQIRENYDNDLYVVDKNKVVKMDQQGKRCVIIDIEKTKEGGLDLDGFFN